MKSGFKLSFSLIIIPLLIAIGCQKRIDIQEVEQYLMDLETEYEIICKQAGMEVWQDYSDTSKNTLSSYKASFAELLYNDDLFNKINGWNEKSGEIENDTLVRRLDLWSKILTMARVDFYPDIVDLQTTLDQQLISYPSDEATAEELEKSIMELIRMRNEKAKELGYGNYAYMVLQNTGIDTSWFEQAMEKFDKVSEPGYQDFLESHFGDKNKADYNDIRDYIVQSHMINQSPRFEDDKKEELMYELLSGIGIDINELPVQFEVTELPTGIAGFGAGIDIPNVFRAVSMKDLSFFYLLHELGHGLHWTAVQIGYPVLEGYEWCKGNLDNIFCEANAEAIAGFSHNSEWLMRNGYTQSQVDSLIMNRREIFPVTVKLRLINSLFEINLYRYPDKNPAEIRNELYAKYLKTDMDFSKGPNLLRLQYVSYPVYEQNYLFAEVISWQIHQYLEKKYGKDYAFNPEVGNFLKDIWKDGELYTWDERLQRAIGTGLDIEAYLGHFLGK